MTSGQPNTIFLLLPPPLDTAAITTCNSYPFCFSFVYIFTPFASAGVKPASNIYELGNATTEQGQLEEISLTTHIQPLDFLSEPQMVREIPFADP